MISGHLPYENPDTNILRGAVLNEPIPEVEGVPLYVQNALKRGLAKNSNDRYKNCIDFVKDLKEKEETNTNEAPLRKFWMGIMAIGLIVLGIGVYTGAELSKGISVDAPKTPVAIQPATSRADVKKDENFTIPLAGGVKLEMIYINPGTFTMGSPENETGRDSDETQHTVTLTQGYWLGKYEVTQEQYQALMGENPSHFKGESLPVESVSWNDATEFCKKLTAQERAAGRLPEGYEYTLPTEAQWEYACRAGTSTALNSGKNLTSGVGSCPNLNEVGWYDENSDDKTHTVGQKQPNAWGLYDMHGNVDEWCMDGYKSYSGTATDPTGPVSGSFRVTRGGSCWNRAQRCRAADRYYGPPEFSISCLGFRLALSLVQ